MMRDTSFAERRRVVSRRNDSMRQDFYPTRRDWIIGELILGFVSVATALTGISGGLVGDTLARTGNNVPWFVLFFSSGAAFILLSFIETRCRARGCGREVLLRYAYIRFGTHVINFFAWVMAFLWLHFSGLNVASIYYEALPLAAANFWGLIEHAKAMWLRPCQARTTSLFVSLFHQRSRG